MLDRHGDDRGAGDEPLPETGQILDRLIVFGFTLLALGAVLGLLGLLGRRRRLV